MMRRISLRCVRTSTSSGPARSFSWTPSFQGASFRQSPVKLGNQYREDSTLQSIVARVLPPTLHAAVSKDFEQFGERVVTDILSLGNEAEEFPPKLKKFHSWEGHDISKVETCRAWKDLKRISCEERLVSSGYDRKSYQEYARFVQFVKVFLFAPSCAVFTCPLAMTDGAARLIEVHGTKHLKENILPHLLSERPESFWTSGQWMTDLYMCLERTGGSDVSRTETIAVEREEEPSDSHTHNLFGFKWFTSSTDSEMAFALARIADEEGNAAKKLSLFFLETFSADSGNGLNKIIVNRLKDKMGTKALPTAEMQLSGSHALQVGPEGRGVPLIANMINVTRVWNSICAVAGMRRMVALARDYATRRQAFGGLLSGHSLHLATLAELEVSLRGNMHFVFEAVRLMGLAEAHPTRDDGVKASSLLRILTPVLKAFTAKETMKVMSEGIEAIGGHAYIEENHIAVLMRDCQVLPIWEGTTNVQSLDVLRVLRGRGSEFADLCTFIDEELASCSAGPIRISGLSDLHKHFQVIRDHGSSLVGHDTNVAEPTARRFLFAIANVYVGTLLCSHAVRTSSESDIGAAEMWISGQVEASKPLSCSDRNMHLNRLLALDIENLENYEGARYPYA